MNCCIAVCEINQLRLAALPPEQKVNEWLSSEAVEHKGGSARGWSCWDSVVL